MPEGAVETVEQARPLTERVVEWALRLGLRFGGIFLQVRLADCLDPTGCTLGRTLRDTFRYGRKITRVHIRGIEVVRGLCPVEFQGVVAHELGHVWVATRRLTWPRWIEEGFCETLAYRFYRDLATPESLALARRIEENPDPLYGAGFRFVSERLGSAGLEGFVRHQTASVISSCLAIYSKGGF